MLAEVGEPIPSESFIISPFPEFAIRRELPENAKSVGSEIPSVVPRSCRRESAVVS